MTEDQKKGTATDFLVVAMHNGNGPSAFKVVSIVGDEAKAIEIANDFADKNEDTIFGVYEKFGTACLKRQVEWTPALAHADLT